MTIKKAKRLLELGDIESARQHLLQLADDHQDDASIWLLLSGIASRTEDWELGRISFGKLVEIRPSSGLASSGLVQCLYKLRRYDEAINEIDRFAGIANRHDETDCAVLEEHNNVRKRIEPDK